MAKQKKDKVVLIGMPGCGKTTIGSLLAKKLGYRFYDMDEWIEKLSGKSISELFAAGESVFRGYETEVCRRLVKEKMAVIAAGGGVVKTPENIEILKKDCIIVYLSRPVSQIAGDVDLESRPLLRAGLDRLFALYEERHALYESAGDMTVQNSTTLDAAAEAAALLLKEELAIESIK